ncbi:MAG: alpha/beta hydrolase fold domain-containing protein [Pseudomonadota bacterium]
MPSYTLAPEARIGAMSRQIARAVEVAAERVGGPIRLAGHSAGGHLAMRMICADDLLGASVFARVQSVLSISGLHDLRPLMQTAMNGTLQLDEAEALAESPALLRPRADVPVTAWVGGGERPEFLRQARLLATMWEGLDTRARAVVDDDHHHFSVIEGLRSGESAITAALLEDGGL